MNLYQIARVQGARRKGDLRQAKTRRGQNRTRSFRSRRAVRGADDRPKQQRNPPPALRPARRDKRHGEGDLSWTDKRTAPRQGACVAHRPAHMGMPAGCQSLETATPPGGRRLETVAAFGRPPAVVATLDHRAGCFAVRAACFPVIDEPRCKGEP